MIKINNGKMEIDREELAEANVRLAEADVWTSRDRVPARAGPAVSGSDHRCRRSVFPPVG